MPVSRKKSCQQCRMAKARCSLEQICQRCLQRGLFCEYVAGTPRWDPYGSTNLAGTAPWTASTMPAPFTSFLGGLRSDEQGIPQNLIDTNITGQAPASTVLASDSIQVVEAQETIHQQPEEPGENAALSTSSAAIGYAPREASLFFPWSDSTSLFSTLPKMDLNLTGRLSPLVATPAEIAEEGGKITVVYGLRYEQFLRPRKETNLQRALMLRIVLGQVQDFPRRLIHGSRLPPFIHPQCALNNRLPRECIAKNGSHQCFPEPLAICASLTQLFFSRSGGHSTSYVWKLIYAEQKRLYSEHHTYDGPTLLASVQAMSLYMLLQAKDHETISRNNVAEMTVTLTEMAKRLHQHQESGPYLQDIYKLPHLNQKSWAFYEGIRRSSNFFRVLGTVLNVLIGNPSLSPDCGKILSIPLICHGYLWDTDTAESWAERLHRYESQRACQERVLVIGDLMGLQAGAASPNGEISNHPLPDPLLQKDLAAWCDNLDEFGTLVWMASLLDREPVAC
ncbi:hypothetical protein GGR57DRAFT_462593 [Xylariaceae sp. FL1272]|nr:hypothetical protein GGR57DRAFT_462593 [Xylariaceae sp. FL1272]